MQLENIQTLTCCVYGYLYTVSCKGNCLAIGDNFLIQYLRTEFMLYANELRGCSIREDP